MLDFIERYKFAILGTVIFHVGIFFYTNFVTIQRPYALLQPELPFEVPLDDVPIDPAIMEMLDMKQQNASLGDQNQQITNTVSDQNDRRDRSYENFSTQEMDAQVMNNAKNLEQQYFDEWASTHTGSQTGKQNSDASMDVNTNRQQQADRNQTYSNQIDTQGSNAAAGDVMASFNLKDRKAHALEKPGYTCNSAGTVTIEIKVGRDGDVQSVTYLPGSSSNATECMIEQSIKYAKRSRFSYSSTAPALQTGTITYKFVSK